MRGSIEKTEWDKVYQKLIEKFCKDGKVNNCAEIYNKMVDLIA
jgi:pentatricopeptide repeat protein